jgi:LuxR family maltose regulon positive regulatory protein
MCSDITLFHALMNIAWSMFDTREDLAAREALAQALAIGARRNYMNCHPWWIPEVMSRLLSRALASGIEVEYVCRLIRHRAVCARVLDIVSWPWPIRIVTLGEFRVEIDGAPLSFEGKAQAKPLELLKALLSFGGRGGSRANALSMRSGPMRRAMRVNGHGTSRCIACVACSGTPMRWC